MQVARRWGGPESGVSLVGEAIIGAASKDAPMASGVKAFRDRVVFDCVVNQTF